MFRYRYICINPYSITVLQYFCSDIYHLSTSRYETQEVFPFPAEVFLAAPTPPPAALGVGMGVRFQWLIWECNCRRVGAACSCLAADLSATSAAHSVAVSGCTTALVQKLPLKALS
jgi:hypothetical protein